MTLATYAVGFDNFEDADEIDVSDPHRSRTEHLPTDQVTVVNDLAGIAGATRKDCVVVTSPDRAAVVNNIDPVNDTLETTNQFSAVFLPDR